ncbi:hypothetical protein G5I_02906 [Acromyrmex echinatior]|uniref:Uncharacterized protein n=1 Tax=Acromyrmex echinatior TaxID=103372 RepID=F4WBJ3_ACREC|nr:hypothetical protein G5I_02906 [Acromyrmex echinatior]
MRQDYAVASIVANRNFYMRRRFHDDPDVQELIHCQCQCISPHQDIRKKHSDDQTANEILCLNIKDEVFKAVKPIYEELSSDDLLSRCLGGYTQNNNESFNSVLWSIAPKGVHSSKAIVDIAANIAVCNFNDGLKSVLKIMQVLNLTISTTCYNFCIKTDERRIRAAERAMTAEAKAARRLDISNKKAKDDEDLNLEGQLYGPGIAD